MTTMSPGGVAGSSPAELKEMGNKYYAQRKYDEALECYTAAISKNPTVPTYFTNRALCYLKKYQWDLVIKDCRRALDLDPNLVKAHFFMGQALQELDSMDECVACLQRASDLAKDNKQHFGDDIAMATRIAKRKRWNAAEEKRITEEIELQSFLNRLIQEETERQIQKLRLDLADAAPQSEMLADALKTARTAAPVTASIDPVENVVTDAGDGGDAENFKSPLATTPLCGDKSDKASEADGKKEGKKDDSPHTEPDDDEKDDVNEDIDHEIREGNEGRESDGEDADASTNSEDTTKEATSTTATVVMATEASKSTDVRSLTEKDIQEKIEEIKAYHAKMTMDLNSVFAQVDDRRKKREVPDFLCGKISFELLRDPVITPSGITYDRKDIEEHIQRVGHFDPVTRVTLTQEQLIPNFGLKEVVDHFVAENAWAVDF